MIGIVKTIDGVKKIVPLDKQLVAGLDSNIPDNAILKFSNTNNRVEGTGWKEVVQCNGQIHSLTLVSAASCSRSIDISRSYSPNSWGSSNWDYPNRDRMAIGAGNAMNGIGFKQVYGFANVACPMNDSTTIFVGSVNCQKVGATSGLAMGMGVYNEFSHTIGSAIAYGLSNCVYGINSPDLPADLSACVGIAESIVTGIGNKVCTAWSAVYGLNNTAGGWTSINIEDPDTHVITNQKIVGTTFAFGNDNVSHGAGVTTIGGHNTSLYALNSAAIGSENKLCGCTASGYKYNQFVFGISNCSCGFDTIAIGTSNTSNAPATVNVGHWNTICAGAAGGLAIGNGAYVYHCCGFTRSLIRAGGSGGGVGTTPATQYSTQIWMVSGCGTLYDFYQAMMHGNTKDHAFVGDIKLSLGATCGTINFMNKVTGAARTEQLSGDIWFTGAGGFSFQDGVEWFMAGESIHDNYLLHDVWQYRDCPLEAHVQLTTA